MDNLDWLWMAGTLWVVTVMVATLRWDVKPQRALTPEEKRRLRAVWLADSGREMAARERLQLAEQATRIQGR